MDKRPERFYSNSAQGAALRKMGQRKIAIADDMPFGEEVKNAVANRTMVLADGSTIRTRRAAGGVDSITVMTPTKQQPSREFSGPEKENPGEYYFAVEVYLTSDLWLGGARPAGYIIVEITEEHEIVQKEIILYPSGSDIMYYSTVYENAADPFGGGADFKEDYKWLLGPNNEQLFVGNGDFRYWELNSDGYWSMTEIGATVRNDARPDDFRTRVGELAWGRTDTSALAMVNTDSGATVEVGQTLTYINEDALRSNTTPACAGYYANYTETSSTSGQIFQIWEPEMEYCSRDGAQYCYMFAESSYSMHTHTASGSADMTFWNTTADGTAEGWAEAAGCFTLPADEAIYEGLVPDAEAMATATYDADVAAEISSVGGVYNETCHDTWVVNVSPLVFREWSHVNHVCNAFLSTYYIGVDIIGDYTTTYGWAEVTAFTETESSDAPSVGSATLHANAFGVEYEIAGTPANFWIGQLFSHKYYEPQNNNNGALFACGCSLDETNAYDVHNAEDPTYMVLAYAMKKKDSVVFRYYIEGPSQVNQSGWPYLEFPRGNETYYSQGHCFWGEKIPNTQVPGGGKPIPNDGSQGEGIEGGMTPNYGDHGEGAN